MNTIEFRMHAMSVHLIDIDLHALEYIVIKRNFYRIFAMPMLVITATKCIEKIIGFEARKIVTICIHIGLN